MQPQKPAGRFQIVATLGPASFNLAGALAAAGATSLRLNASHMQPAALGAAVESVRQQVPGMPLVIDLQGAKMRLGHFRERSVEADQMLIFTSEVERRSAIPLPHPELYRAARVGETLTADDGRFHFRILESSDSTLVVTALDKGVLKPRKGINLLEHPIELARLTAEDREHLASVRHPAQLSWAFSFMKDGSETQWLRQKIEGCRVIGKVERQEAIDRMKAIGESVDEIWICRGDLGEQVGPARMARFVGGIDPREYKVPVLMAGQVLEHLTEHPEPTRSEVCHLYDLAARGFAGVVLSDETAIGKDPVHAVRRARELVDQFFA